MGQKENPLHWHFIWAVKTEAGMAEGRRYTDISGKGPGQGVRRLILIFTLWLTISIAMGQSLNFSGPLFPHQ